MPGDALLAVMTDVTPEAEDELNRWYDEEHVQSLLAVPGFLTGRRFRAVQADPKYLAIYDVDDVTTLERPDYLAARGAHGATEWSRRVRPHFRNTTRGVYRRLLTIPEPEPANAIEGRGLLLTGQDIAPEDDEEFNVWYDTEHVPYLASVPGVRRVRRYARNEAASGLEGAPTHYLALYDLDSPSVFGSPEWNRMGDTPWTWRMRAKFRRRIVHSYERIYPR